MQVATALASPRVQVGRRWGRVAGIDSPTNQGASLCFLLSPAKCQTILSGMLIVHVHVKVKPDFIDAFRRATVTNAQSSRKEPGIARFDVLQQPDDPTRFVLVEAYRTAEAPAAHKETSHYQTWRDTVAEMMAEPRQSVKFTNIDPPDALFGAR
jgi:(4S)-4-hydroxy-5-phosphonooxypentane-2,3-dione isomerase